MLQEQIEVDFIGLAKVFVSSDGASIVVGNNWLNEIVNKLGSADIYIVLCSQDSVDRPWINIELGAALSYGKKVIPIYHTDLTVDQFQRRPLSDYEGFNAHDPVVLGLENNLDGEEFVAIPICDEYHCDTIRHNIKLSLVYRQAEGASQYGGL